MASTNPNPDKPSYDEVERMLDEQREEIRKENERYDAQHPSKKQDSWLKRLVHFFKKK